MLKILLLTLLLGITTAQADTLAISRKTTLTTISSSGFNTNFDQIEAVVNGHIDADNLEDDSVTALKLNPDVVRSGFGLIQHTDGSLYVDVSDTNPALEITDGGLRVKLDGAYFQRTSSGISVQSGVFALLTGDQTIAGSKTFSSAIVASGGVTGALTGNVIGNVTGNVTGNITGTVSNQLGAWATKSVDTAYQATTDGFFVGYIQCDDFKILTIQTDSNNPPTTTRQVVGCQSTTTGVYSAFSIPVRKNDYYRALASGSADTYSTGMSFIPYGS